MKLTVYRSILNISASSRPTRRHPHDMFRAHGTPALLPASRSIWPALSIPGLRWIKQGAANTCDMSVMRPGSIDPAASEP